jgi:hypothetical protein
MALIEELEQTQWVQITFNQVYEKQEVSDVQIGLLQSGTSVECASLFSSSTISERLCKRVILY